MKQETFNIVVWPDGSWVEEDEYNCIENMWRGDDCCIAKVPLGTYETNIDKIAEKAVVLNRN